MNRTLKICALIALTAGIWACDEGKYNDLTCDPAEYKSECIDGKYYFLCLPTEQRLDKRECSEGTKCSDDTGEAVCVADPNYIMTCNNGDTQCEGDFTKTCIQNTWVKAALACPNGCENGSCKDAPVNTCNNGDTKCNEAGDGILVCNDNAWGNGDSCENGCENGVCKEADINKCDSSTDQPKCDIDAVTLLTCSENVWSPESCLFGCEEGACKDADVCDPEEDTAPKCALDNATILTCSEDSVWAAGDKCENGCEDGACKANSEDPVYEPCDSTVDTAKCGEDGISLMTCADTDFWVPQSCTFGCDAEVPACKVAGACDSETDTEPACAPDNTTIITCESDVWVPGDVCPNGCEEGKCKDNGGDEPVACDSSTDQPKCEDDNITRTACTDDVWVSESCLFGCEEGACKDADACDAETDTAPKCALDNATILTCTESLWTAGEKCANGCEDGVCKEGEKVCDPACENGEVCVEGECKDPNACDSANDAPKCGGEGDAYVVTCTENLWVVAEEACENGCENGECKEAE